MKQKLREFRCFLCGWKVTSHKALDGLKCPDCKGPTTSREVKSK